MRKKMQNLLITTALWVLEKCHYQIPVIRPNIISRDLGKRTVAQEKIDYWRLQEWSTQSFEFDKHIKCKVKEALAQKIADEIEVFTLKSPDGIIYKADVVYTDMQPLYYY